MDGSKFDEEKGGTFPLRVSPWGRPGRPIEASDFLRSMRGLCWRTETGTYGGFDNKVQIIQKIPHEGEVNRYAGYTGSIAR